LLWTKVNYGYEYDQTIIKSQQKTYPIVLPLVVGRMEKQQECPANRHRVVEQTSDIALHLAYYITPADVDARSHSLWTPPETAAMPTTLQHTLLAQTICTC